MAGAQIFKGRKVKIQPMHADEHEKNDDGQQNRGNKGLVITVLVARRAFCRIWGLVWHQNGGPKRHLGLRPVEDRRFRGDPGRSREGSGVPWASSSSILTAFASFRGRFCIDIFLEYRANRLIVGGIPNQSKIRKL